MNENKKIAEIIPVSNAGNTRLCHRLLDAIAAAVVGPPIFAFEARIISLNDTFKSLATPMEKKKCTSI